MEFVQRTKFSEKVGMHANTIDTWFQEMESKGIHFVNTNERNKKIYDDLDLEIALFIKEKRKDNEYTVPGAVEAVREAFAGRLRLDVIQDRDEKQLATVEQLERRFMAMVDKRVEQRVEQEVQRRLQTEIQQLLIAAAPDPQEERARELDRRLSESRIRSKLRDEARNEWYKLPEDQRTLKTGFLSLKRVEDKGKKLEFIEEYINKHYDDRVRDEFSDVIEDIEKEA
jgi:hypothetical protein